LATLRTNLLGWFLLVAGIVYFVGVIVVYWIRGIHFWKPRASGEMVREESSNLSFWLIVLGMISAFYLPPIEYLFFDKYMSNGLGIQITGLIFIGIGSALFLWARRKLGKYYSGHVSVVEGQCLVQSGPYRIIRHPAYAGYLLMCLGLALGYSSVTALVAIFSLLLPAIIYRLTLEEKFLVERFYEDFNKYAAVTKKIIPGIW
jgi:protein-S-isoprenylcysteine O-methyltransferase Ste14